MSDFSEAVSSVTSAQCPEHSGVPVAGICVRCGTFGCFVCLTPESGLCFRCRHFVPALATPGVRLLASLIDLAVCWTPSLIASALLLPLFAQTEGDWAALQARVFWPPMFLVWAGQAWLVHRRGQSLGKRAVGIRLVREDGQAVALWRVILLRNMLPCVLGAMCGPLWLVDVLFVYSPERRCIHDRLAGTLVVRTR
ncbi:RDD family protein [Corallococcus sp. M34]|uniref:RDD family protein n=1 Tax=Citreicoccus inhibens TaxID=2849499 RepID=UPI001C2230BF|nr:RDD family protein [Citreicoccus inhibens]MBU8900782.1 RDD family protein [Citreicoccus inhibens]